MRVWWRDECSFNIESIFKHQQKYLTKENQHKIEKKTQKNINIWAIIKGDESLIFNIHDEILNTENYVELLNSHYIEMEYNTSFFMEDGAGPHT